MIINDEFKYCATTKSSLRVDLDNLCPSNCKINKTIDHIFPKTLREANFTVLAKRQHKVNGIGNLCSRKIITLNCTMYWYLSKEIFSITSNIQ